MTDHQPPEPAPDAEPTEIVILEINLRELVLPDGRRAWRFQSTVGADNLQMLGLLAAGTHEVYSRMTQARR